MWGVGCRLGVDRSGMVWYGSYRYTVIQSYNCKGHTVTQPYSHTDIQLYGSYSYTVIQIYNCMGHIVIQ